ncbi:hypothetical protein APHAL10511_006685 [Amanita phalloides]|nr:hypothetical protein APHAL10511_006685 [Amanita phalloides]
MLTFFLFFLLGFLTVGQAALQYGPGTVDNDTIIFTKLTLEDIFGARNLDKRLFKKVKSKITKPSSRHPPLHGPISVPLKKTTSGPDYWYIKVSNLEFEIDTYEVCTSIPNNRPPETGARLCPNRPRPDFLRTSGYPHQSQITISGITSDPGLLIRDQTGRNRGILGWTLSDSTMPEEMHFLPKFLSKFESPVFAMYLSHGHYSKLDIGGFDHTNFDTEVHNVVTTEGHQPWLIGSLRIFVGQTVIETTQAAFDSTTPYIYGPPTEVVKIHNLIRAGEGSGDGFVYFKWGNGNKWPLKPGSNRLGHPYWDQYRDLFKPVGSGNRWLFGREFMYEKYMGFKAGPGQPQVIIGSRKLPAFSDIAGPPRSHQNQPSRQESQRERTPPPPYNP